ncbi:ABC-three component system protein [Bifidobacterium parmae]|uniref:ABC-three component systems C-terminal domain-containing protein n=1 Tax=Bifidobacterium parmae TaxID=361854 RepID=A0A2N5IZC8_9BIFI|nr:ABC-three component system protein [Bifidobacterium parmae]PLS27301.1 hypothetical protein Uis4E_1697 [Bifidobacterium parmae]
MADVSFKQIMDKLRPSLQGQQNLGMFTAQLIDMGLMDSGDDDQGQTALDIVKASTWRMYANGTRKMSRKVACELVGRWDQFQFAERVKEAYGEDVLIDLATALRPFDTRIGKGNVARMLAALLYRVFATISGFKDQVSSLESSPEHPSPVLRKVESTGALYYDEATNRIHLGDDFRSAAEKADAIPADIQQNELVYVKALIHAYCEKSDLHGREPETSDIPDKYKDHFVEQRKAFFSAEWLKETSWDCTDQGEPAFRQFLEEIRQGVREVNLDDYPTQVKRMFMTLTQSTNVQLNGIALNRIEGLIDIWCRKGACHELVSEGLLGWEG